MRYIVTHMEQTFCIIIVIALQKFTTFTKYHYITLVLKRKHECKINCVKNTNKYINKKNL